MRSTRPRSAISPTISQREAWDGGEAGSDNSVGTNGNYGFGAGRILGILGGIEWADYALLIFVVAMIGVFAIDIPSKFLSAGNLEDILSQNAIPGLLALAVVLPLAGGEFDLSVAANLGFCSVVSAYMASHGVPAGLVVASAIVVGILIGALCALMVVGVRINAFIATLGIATALSGGNLAVTNGETIYEHVSRTLSGLAISGVGGIQIVVFYFVVLAIVVWYLLERTSFGRYLRATGLGRDATRLSGVRTGGYLVAAFVGAGTLAGLCGVLQTAQFGSANEAVGPSFLLPAYAAAFLGATTIKRGRFNAWGTVIGVVLLGVGINGLTLLGAPTWVTQLFDGAALLLSVGFAVAVGRRQREKV